MSIYVYVICEIPQYPRRVKAVTPCKIGISTSPEFRLMQLQGGNPRKLELVHQEPCETVTRARGVEKLMKDKFARERMEGEWYLIDYRTAVSAIQDVLHSRLKAVA